MRRIALALSLASLAALAACAGAEKLGDRAAATGDWKTAEAQYAAALRDNPNDPAMRQKYGQARQGALAGALNHARACEVAQDWECAYGELDYATRLEPGNTDYAAGKMNAARNVGSLRIRRAAEASARRDHKAAFDLYARGRDVSPDPAVQAEAARALPGIVGAAVQDAQAFRRQKQYPQAVELLTLAAGLDGRVRPQLDQARAEYDAWLNAQYEASAQQGDQLLRAGRFAEAQAAYQKALELKKGGRAEPLARYAGDLNAGAQAIQRRDWPGATRAYDDAVKTGMDGGGFAAAELEKVRPRPIAIRVHSALVKPVRPDGSPWTGPRGPGFERVVGMLAAAALDRGGIASRIALDVYDAMPHENRPNLFATLTLPDGRQYLTPVLPQVLHARFDGFVVLATNSYDDRPVGIRIAHQDAAGVVELGTASVKMSDLMKGGTIGLTDRSVVELKVSAEPSQLQDGAAQVFAPPAPAAQRAPAAGPAGPAPRAPATAPAPRR